MSQDDINGDESADDTTVESNTGESASIPESVEWGEHLEEYMEDEWEEVEDRDDIRYQVDEDDLADLEDTEANPPPSMELVTERGTQPTKSKNNTYLFCPLAHRLPIMRLFAKHASQHSLLPERHGQARSAADIRRDAVHEMYQHCVANNLREVWAYLWNSWYARSRWPLWARSANEASIPCKRTTMVVEALWRNLKRFVLHLYNRPPIDLATYAIITKTLPPYRLTLSTILGNSQRAGRSQSLTHMQTALKKSWKRLMKVPIKRSYATDILTWTCDCSTQKYHSYLLCKHLVQAAGNIPPSWWPKAIRYHIPPFYTMPINGTVAEPPEDKHNHWWLAQMPGASTFTGSNSSDQNLEPQLVHCYTHILHFYNTNLLLILTSRFYLRLGSSQAQGGMV